MSRKVIVSRVQKKPKEAEAWENTAEFSVPLPDLEDPEELEEVPELPEQAPVSAPAVQNSGTEVLYWVILVLVLLIVLLLLIGFFSLRNQKVSSAVQSAETSVPETVPVTEPETLPEKETILIEVPPEPPSENNTELSDFTDFSSLLTDMYSQYALSLDSLSYEVKGGYLTDINQDGLDELILFTDTEPFCYEIYTYQNKKAVFLDNFGSYSSYLYFEEGSLWQITGKDSSIYLHYQDDYDEQSISGWYSARHNSTFSVLTEYSLSRNQQYHVKWHIFYEDAETSLTELTSGATLTTALYEIPPACQKKISSLMEQYSFWAEDSSSPLRLDFMDKETLSGMLQNLSGNET